MEQQQGVLSFFPRKFSCCIMQPVPFHTGCVFLWTLTNRVLLTARWPLHRREGRPRRQPCPLSPDLSLYCAGLLGGVVPALESTLVAYCRKPSFSRAFRAPELAAGHAGAKRDRTQRHCWACPCPDASTWPAWVLPECPQRSVSALLLARHLRIPR